MKSQRLADLSGDRDADDAHLSKLLDGPGLVEDDDQIPEVIRTHLLRDIGPIAAASGGDMLLSATPRDRLSRIVPRVNAGGGNGIQPFRLAISSNRPEQMATSASVSSELRAAPKWPAADVPVWVESARSDLEPHRLGTPPRLQGARPISRTSAYAFKPEPL